MKGFRHFFEEEEQAKHLTALQKVLGIDPEHLKQTPQFASFFGLGGNTYNASGYTVVGLEYDQQGTPTHAKVKLNNNLGTSPRQKYKQVGGKQVEVPDSEPDDKVYLIPVKDLEGLMGQAFSGAGAASAGMPPMMM